MRRIPVLLAVTALAAVGLVGCSSSAGASCARPSAAPATFDLIDVSGPSDAAPEVTVHTPFHVDSTAAEDLEVGDGVAITEPDQLVVLDIALTSGETGEPLIATPYDGDLSRVFPLSRWLETFPGLEGALECATGGSRVVVALPPDGIEPQAAAGLGLDEGESAVAVVDVRKVYLPKADGADQFNQALGLPTVVRAPDGRPGIIVPDATAPTDPVVQVLKRGDGPTVNGDVGMRLEYTAVKWDDHTVVDSTWDTEPASATLDALPPALADALDGQAVGSQVLVVVPADPDATAPQDGAVVYVIDILGIDGD